MKGPEKTDLFLASVKTGLFDKETKRKETEASNKARLVF
jgi:hypothetical protein